MPRPLADLVLGRGRHLPSIALSLSCMLAGPFAAHSQEAPVYPGGKPTRVHALTHALIIPEPGKRIEDGTIVIRDGLVEAIGTGVRIAPDARIWDFSGRTVYAGLIEPYLRLEPEKEEEEKEATTAKTYRAPSAPPASGEGAGAVDPNPRVHPERSMADEIRLGDGPLAELRELGFTAALIVPDKGIFRGTSAFVNLCDGSPNQQVVRPDVAQHLAFEHGSWGEETGYPNSLMGSIALIRQTLLDAGHHASVLAAYERRPRSMERPLASRSLEALGPVVSGERPVAIEVEDIRMALRAHRLAGEFELAPWIVSGGCDEYERLAEVKAAKLPLILALNFPEPPAWEDEDEAVAIELDRLRHWELAPSNPHRLEEAGIPFSLTTQGLKKRADFRDRARTAIERGLSPDAALAAFTVEPAALVGVENQLGTLAAGKIANLTVTDGDLFALDSNILEVWVDGARYAPRPRVAKQCDAAGTWEITLIGMDRRPVPLVITIEHKEGRLLGHRVTATEPDTTRIPLARVAVSRGRLEITLPGELVEVGTDIQITAEIIEKRRLSGSWSPAGGEGAPRLVRGVKARTKEKPPEPPIAERSSPFPPLPEPAPPSVIVHNATIWTSGPSGILPRSDLLVRDGKIEAVGAGLDAPADALVIDGTGKHVTPGIIDCHSHSAISGGVNESTRSTTSEVRIADVIDPESIHIYRHLAGGVTVSNQFHGSANPIGGQSAVIKHRWGGTAAGLRFEGAAPGIKFALGENVKQSNWGDRFRTRYPQTRMGVEQWIRDRFLAARDYRREWEEWRRDRKKLPPPRRDLQLEALVEVLDRERIVHCHAYRQDEMLALIRLAEELGFRIGTFEHGLEGYKIANEMAAHGVGGSSFSDWWAYKFEVYDAIPQNGAIMWDRGVLVSFNSDSAELARRLNTEAAKAVRYGGVPETEALEFVTLNPAKMLGVDHRAGSLEPGKDGDFAIWSSSPLSDLARCEQTWIEGQRFFDRERDLAARAEAEAERLALLERARQARAELEARGASTGWQPTFGALHGESERDYGIDLEQGAGQLSIHDLEFLRQAREED